MIPKKKTPRKKKLIKAAEIKAEFSMELGGTIQLGGAYHILEVDPKNWTVA